MELKNCHPIHTKKKNKNEEEEKEEDDKDEYYDSLDLKISSTLKLLPHSIDHVLPLYNSKIFLLCKGTMYECDLKIEKYSKYRSKLSRVYQIALIESSGDVLLLMEDRKEIKRISNGSLVDTYVRMDDVEERYNWVGGAGE